MIVWEEVCSLPLLTNSRSSWLLCFSHIYFNNILREIVKDIRTACCSESRWFSVWEECPKNLPINLWTTALFSSASVETIDDDKRYKVFVCPSVPCNDGNAVWLSSTCMCIRDSILYSRLSLLGNYTSSLLRRLHPWSSSLEKSLEKGNLLLLVCVLFSSSCKTCRSSPFTQKSSSSSSSLWHENEQRGSWESEVTVPGCEGCLSSSSSCEVLLLRLR